MKLVLLAHPNSFTSASMPRFAGMILHGMSKRGHQVEIETSQHVFGRLPIRSPFVRKWLGYVDQYVVYPRRLWKLADKAPDDTLFVVTDQALGMWVPALAHRPHVIHCHDFLALKSALGEFPENSTGWTGRKYQRLICKGFTRGKAFISVSRKTKDDLHRFLPRSPNISEVVYNGLNHPFRPLNQEERKSLLDEAGLKAPDEGFVLHVGGNQWYKNREGVLEIYRAYASTSRRPAELWMIGATPADGLRTLAASIPTPGRVRFVTGLTNEQVNAAYSSSRALLFPSLEEGFGWPVVEAMASRCPVITTDTAPLNETAGSTARLISRMPANGEAQKSWVQFAAQVLDEFVRMDERSRTAILNQGQLHAGRFNTDDVMSAYEAVYSRTLLETN